MSTNIAETLAEREQQYGKHGDFLDKSCFIQTMKEAFRETAGWEHCLSDQREALDMIVHKIGRILEGSPDHADSWRDVAGYAMLIVQRLEEK
jgi:hypothetical protein